MERRTLAFPILGTGRLTLIQWKPGFLLRIIMGKIPSGSRGILEGKFWMLYMKMENKLFTQ